MHVRKLEDGCHAGLVPAPIQPFVVTNCLGPAQSCPCVKMGSGTGGFFGMKVTSCDQTCVFLRAGK